MIYNQYHGEIHQGKCVDETIQEYFPQEYVGVFFDVGAYEPINISNSYHFEKNGWDVYCFEANPLLINDLERERNNVFNYAISIEDKSSIEFNVVTAYGGGSYMAGISAIDIDPQYMDKYGQGIRKMEKVTVRQKSLSSILATELNNIDAIDVLSIDVEGGELNVLKGLDLNKYKPKLIVTENVFNSPDVQSYLEIYGYRLDKHIDYNQYYVSKSLIKPS